MEIELVNCFCTKNKTSGNPAAIVRDFVLGDHEKQKIAKDLGMPVTIFLSKTANENHIEFFYPDTEMPLCLHGTIGAAYILFEDNTKLKSLIFVTKAGRKLFIRKEKDVIQVLVHSQTVPEILPQKIEIIKMLNLIQVEQIDDAFPLVIASVGSPKLLVPLKSFELLATLKPDLDLIVKWSKESSVNGLYVYTKNSHEDFDFYARGFNPKTGHNEDAATGVAAAALALMLKKSITVGQGRFMNRPSEIKVSYDDSNNIWVGGKVIFVSKLLRPRSQ